MFWAYYNNKKNARQVNAKLIAIAVLSVNWTNLVSSEQYLSLNSITDSGSSLSSYL